MSSIWGRNLKISVFGESHGKAVGVTIDGLPSGIKLDLDKINYIMKLRAPGTTPWSTPRKETDQVEILSGFHNGYTSGTPLTGIIRSTNQHSKDYENLRTTPRPAHADYTGSIRYNGFNDMAGGGHFSGRLTAPINFAGAIAIQMLEDKDIIISSRIYSIGEITDGLMDYANPLDMLSKLTDDSFPTISKEAKDAMIDYIMEAKKDGDSTGGVIETIVTGMPAGIGSPIFDNVESNIASILFSVPAVKGIEFGAGFDITKLYGSNANDEYIIKDGEIATSTNNNGGILGGITNSMPIVVRCAIKPTPSIHKIQKSVDIENMEDAQIQVHGRHDPCIVPRAIPVIKGSVALAIVDTWLSQKSWEG